MKDLILSWLSGAVAGSIETVICMPFEVTKTRQQVLASTGTGKWSNRPRGPSMLSSMRETVRLGGVRALYAGLPICLIQTSGKVGIRFGTFEAFKRTLGADQVLLSGCLAGATEAALWITPCERLKVLQQMQVGRRAPAASGQNVMRHVAAGGFTSLYRGLLPTVLRNGGSVGFRLASYQEVVSWLRCVDRGRGRAATCSAHEQQSSSRAWHSAAAGALVGGASTVLNNPVDVVKSRMQADGIGASSSGSGGIRGLVGDGISTHVVQLYRQGGLRIFFSSGLPARMWKISLGQAIIFSSYEKVSSHLESLLQ